LRYILCICMAKFAFRRSHKRRQRTGSQSHFEYGSKSLENLIHRVKLLTCVWRCPVQILPRTCATCNEAFRVFLSPSGQNDCIVEEPSTGALPLPSTIFPHHDSLITHHLRFICSDNPIQFLTIHKSREPTKLSFISCKTNHYSNCNFVAIFLNNN
jgi:hypothetical protein